MRQALVVAPFAPRLVQLVEARIRVEDMDSQRAAGILTDVTKEIAKLSAEAPRVNREQATLGANAVEQLRGITTEWFNFYNNYDPLFTWWMGMPYAKVDEGLKNYAALLRDKVAAENLQVAATPATSEPIAAGPQLKFADVPDLAEIIALAAGRDARRGREIHRCRRWRARRPGSGWGRAGTRRCFLRRVAGGAEVPRLRQAVAQRAGRLPFHPPHRGNADRARQR